MAELSESEREGLARLLCGADGKVNWTKDIPAAYWIMADQVIASDWLDTLLAARMEAVAAEIEAGAPEVGPHINGSEYRYGRYDGFTLAASIVRAALAPVVAGQNDGEARACETRG